MSEAVNRFYESIEDAQSQTFSQLIEYFMYFLTVEQEQSCATPAEVNACFVACDLSPPSNTPLFLSRGAKSKPPRYIKAAHGYKLQRHAREKIAERIGSSSIVTQTSKSLLSLQERFPEGKEKDFLQETTRCFEAGANRATVVMAWILAVSHLQRFILAKKLSEFNAALATNKDRRVKITSVASFDDFSEIPEGKFIEFCREAKIISNDVRKILEQKLGTRNSAAHPSGVRISQSKVLDFVEDLVENVVLKYTV